MGSADGTSISTSHLAYKWKVEMKRRGSIKEKRKKRDEGIKEKGRKKKDSIIELVIKLLSNIKEQTSSDFVENDIFSITSFLFILFSSESFPMFV